MAEQLVTLRGDALSHRLRYSAAAACLALALAAASAVAAGIKVELQLVPHDEPAVTVEARERETPIVQPVATSSGVEVQRIGLELVCWPRFVLLDDAPVFERYHESKFLFRKPVARPELAAGEHRLWPGDHRFTVTADGQVKSDDPELLIAVEDRPTPAACPSFASSATR